MADATKLKFIQISLEKYGEDVQDAIQRAMASKKVHDTGSLKASIKYNTKIATEFNEGSIEIIFHEYGRMVDMGVGKGRTIANNAEARRDKILKKKPGKKIYSPVAYGFLTPLINRIQYGYTEAVIAQIKDNLINNI